MSTTRTRKAKPAEPAAIAEGPLPRPSAPEPGRWRVTQTIGGKVRQYAFTCERCRVTTYVACNREMDAGSELVEHCPCMGVREREIPNSVLYKTIPNKGRFKPA